MKLGMQIQHATSYAPVKMRNALTPVTNFAQTHHGLAVLGIVLSSTTEYGTMFLLEELLLCGCRLFHLVTLPVELNASSRAYSR